MTPKQQMDAAGSLINHAKLMLQTVAGLNPAPEGVGHFREDYLQWAEQALLRAAAHVKAMRNRS